MATIGDRIFFARREKDITQEELASAVGTTKQNIYKYEKNIITNIPMDKVEQIAGFLNVSPAWIMGWSKESEPTEQIAGFLNVSPAWIMGWSKESEPTSSYLSDNEKSLVFSFRSLSAEGREYILQQIAIAQQIYRQSEDLPDMESKNA